MAPRKGSFTVNARSRLDCATFFFTAACGPRHESCSSDEVVESLWPGRPRLWPHCGYQCSAGVCCALRKRASPNSGLFARVEPLCCESCVQCGPTVYSATRRACGRVEGNFWLLYHLANVRTLTRYTVGGSRHRCLHAARSRLCADCSESRTLALFRSAQHTPAEHW